MPVGKLALIIVNSHEVLFPQQSSSLAETLYYKRILRRWLIFRLPYLISRILLQFRPNSILLRLLLYPILRYPLRPRNPPR